MADAQSLTELAKARDKAWSDYCAAQFAYDAAAMAESSKYQKILREWREGMTAATVTMLGERMSDDQLAANRAAMLENLKWVVRYRTKHIGGGWITMAAYDSESVAKKYAEECTGDGTRPWEYEAFELPEVPTD